MFRRSINAAIAKSGPLASKREIFFIEPFDKREQSGRKSLGDAA
jgi:hypothetical protein